MAISEKQLRANQLNSLKSTGPRTERGRMASRRNAIKHGLTGAGTCLPEGFERELEAEYHALAEIVKPQNVLERRFVEQAAIGSLRFMTAESQLRAGRRERGLGALTDWDAEREAEVELAL